MQFKSFRKHLQSIQIVGFNCKSIKVKSLHRTTRRTFITDMLYICVQSLNLPSRSAANRLPRSFQDFLIFVIPWLRVSVHVRPLWPQSASLCCTKQKLKDLKHKDPIATAVHGTTCFVVFVSFVWRICNSVRIVAFFIFLKHYTIIDWWWGHHMICWTWRQNVARGQGPRATFCLKVQHARITSQ